MKLFTTSSQFSFEPKLKSLRPNRFFIIQLCCLLQLLTYFLFFIGFVSGYFVVSFAGFNSTRVGLSNPSNEVLRQLLMYGSKDLPDGINRNILELTLHFILETGPFD